MTTTERADDVRRRVVDRIREVRIAGGDPIGEELLEDVSLEDGVVTFTVVFDRLDRPMAERLSEQLRGAALACDGVDHVRIEATNAGAPETGLPITGVDSLIAVASSKGGVGKTTITVSLARALDEAGLDVGVFDANVHSPDAPELLEAEGPVRQTPSGRPEPIDADGVQIVSLELIADDGPVAWRGAMVHDVVTDLLGNAAWDDRDVVLVDLPPGIGDAVYTVVQQAPLDGALLVSTPTAAAVRAAERTAALCSANDVPTIGVVSNAVGSDGPYGDGTEGGHEIDPETLETSVNEEALTSIDPIPFDPALREPLVRSFDDPDTDGAAAVASLAERVEAFLAERGGPDVPADAVDLRGLPPATGYQQALTEFGPDGSGSASILFRGDPDDLVEAVGDALERDGRSVTATVDDLGRKGWVIDLETDVAERSNPRSAA
ncbi:P-loop NTPase [Natrarchaeobius oligotrophus]|uniref:DUF59 domain-containing protein n=1 Tax=Natrarchaeobius chitinivorans TaxID=1679083 RepID=A0A3N6MQQ7_NATCH|nr:P-loop NTPase [Natrarchaeobius chitinivorans]RQH00011.1 DUF59 domain-containing protein [Natrarchaeobius chitinivorans]